MAVHSPPRTSDSSGRISPTTASSRLPVRPSSFSSTASRPRSRSSTRRRSATAGPSPTPISSKARRVPRPSSCSGRRTTSRRFTASIRPRKKILKVYKGKPLGQRLPAPGRDVRQQQCRFADAQPVGPHHGPAGPALRLRAQSLLSPNRQDRTAAALHRRRDHERRGGQSGPRQGGPRRRPDLQSRYLNMRDYTLPAEKRQAIGSEGLSPGSPAPARSSPSTPT